MSSASLRRSGTRTWAAVATVAITAIVAFVTVGFVANYRSTMADTLRPIEQTPVYVSFGGPGEIPLAPLPPAVIEEIESADGITVFASTATLFLRSQGHRFVLMATQGPTQNPIFQAASQDARSAVFDSNGVVVTRAFAHLFDVEVGDEIALDGPVGGQLFTVADVLVVPSASPNGAVLMSFDNAKRIAGLEGPTSLELAIDADLLPEAMQMEEFGSRFVEGLVASRGYDINELPLSVVTGRQEFEATMTTIDQTLAVFYLVVAVMLVIAAGLLLNTMVASGIERRGEFGLLRALGARKRLVRNCVWAEAVAIGAVGTVVGVGLGTALHYLVVSTLEEVWVFPISYRFVPEVALLVPLLGLAVVMAAGGFAVWRANRVVVMAALRSAE